MISGTHSSLSIMPQQTNLTQTLKKLEEIAEWFDAQETVDIEEGLRKVKEGALLIKASRERLKSITNEFEEIRKDLEADED